MPKITLVLLLTFITTTLAAQQAITCNGGWSPALSESALIRAYGKANVVRGNVYVAEGEEVPGTIVYPKNEKWRLEIVWKNSRQRVSPEWIRIPTGSQWRTFAGIRNGMALAEVERINGRPFKFYGFDWDYGGSVTDWRSGRLGALDSECSLQITFDRSVPERVTTRQQQALDATSGEVEILSSSANARAFQTWVSEIVIQYPE